MQATKFLMWKEIRKKEIDLFNLSENLHTKPMLLGVSFNGSTSP